MQSSVENANIPAFLGKLWKMVDDPNTDQLISWSQTGTSFIIQNQAQFWYELLPLYYKHNNMSSFVRQLNMYGFHKISTVENGSMDADKDEIQFYHPNFQKDHPEKLINIKRKVTTTKGHDNQSIVRNDELSKVLTDVKQLRGRQSSIDSQLSAMKQENAVLWRELAMLRQKHMKQQQIVNKLIQFLVTLVQPSTPSRMGVGVKRRMPLMIHEGAKKVRGVRGRQKSRPSSDAGPTIFELENEMELSPEQILEPDVEEQLPLVNSPVTSTASMSPDASSKNMDSSVREQNVQSDVTNIEGANRNLCWDKPEFVDMDVLTDNNGPEENFINTLANSAELGNETSDKVFINPNNRNTLLSNLLGSGSYAAFAGKYAADDKKQGNTKEVTNNQSQPTMQVATKNNQITLDSATADLNDSFSKEEFDQHLDHAQGELDQLKDILSGASTFDANALLSLFADSDPDYGIPNTLQNKENRVADGNDPLVSGNELAATSNLLDFDNLLNDVSLNSDDNLGTGTDLSSVIPLDNASLDTPLIVKSEPIFPTST